jgi:SAM-dependent methyltransferase
MKDPTIENDPSQLFRYRDSIYASDLLVCAIAFFDFFTFLNEGPRTFDEICDKLRIQPRPADVLLSLLLSMELVETHDNRYALTDLSATYLVSDKPGSIVPYYCSLKNRPQCVEFREVLKTGKPAGWSSKKEGKDWIKSMQDQEFADSFTAAMDSRGVFLAQRLAERFNFSQHTALLDIAGGSGIYACSIAQVNRHLAATVLEIPPVDLAATRSIESKGMSSRVDVVTGNMFEELPTGYDIHLFANAFHDWDIDSVEKLSANSFRNLSPGGIIAVFDAHLNQFKKGPLSVAEYSCLLMHSTEGKCYSTKEIGDILTSAGFGQVKVTDVAADRSLITGKKD